MLYSSNNNAENLLLSLGPTHTHTQKTHKNTETQVVRLKSEFPYLTAHSYYFTILISYPTILPLMFQLCLRNQHGCTGFMHSSSFFEIVFHFLYTRQKLYTTLMPITWESLIHCRLTLLKSYLWHLWDVPGHSALSILQTALSLILTTTLMMMELRLREVRKLN